MTLTCDEFLKNLHEANLLNEAEIRQALDLVSAGERPADGEAIATLLVVQQKLTPYQAHVILQGKGEKLTLGNYVIEDQLGRGGMGTVYRAHHQNMKRRVALKVVNKQVSKHRHLMKRFHREVEAAAKLNHPHIVVAHDADEFQGTWYLVMELVDGKDLSTIVKRNGPLTIRQALDLIRQAATGLAYAHEQGVVHRDIKPSNLLLDRSGTVKILDMGLARIEKPEDESALTTMDAVLGTADFMAPEQAANTRDADARSDLYSLGCTLWYLLTGTNVYGGDTLMAKMWAHHDQPIPSLASFRDDATPELQAIFEKMVAKTPSDRYQSMAELIADLEKFQSGDLEVSAIQSILQSDAGERLDLREQPAIQAGPPTEVSDTEFDLPSQVDGSFALREESSATVGVAPPRRRDRSKRRMPAILGIGVVLLSASLVMFFGGKDDHHDNAVAPASDKNVLTGEDPKNDETKTAVVPGSSSEPPQQGPLLVKAQPAPDINPPLGAQNPFSVQEAADLQQSWAEYLKLPVEQTNTLGMSMKLIPPARFQMGSTRDEIDQAIRAYSSYRENDVGNAAGPEWNSHQVTITRPIYCAATEVTAGQFAEFVAATGYKTDAEKAGNKPSQTWQAEQRELARAACWISWNDATEFCRWLSEKEQRDYRLPTEAEWEFVCRAGSMGAVGREFEEIKEYAWVSWNTNQVMPVGLKQANPFGLHDLLGNVTEWCQDYFSRYSLEPVEDPLIASPTIPQKMRILRGGDFDTPVHHARPTKRGFTFADRPSPGTGFRVVVSVEWNPTKPLGFPSRNAFNPALVDTDRGTHRKIEVLTELKSAKINQSPWVSPDGLRIYWETNGTGDRSALLTASRPDLTHPFENRKELGTIRQPKLSEDELRVVGVIDGPKGLQLAEGSRESLDDPFAVQPIAELGKVGEPNSPSFGSNGRVMVFQQGGWKRPQVVWCQRRSRADRWTRPVLSLFQDISFESQELRATWPVMDPGTGLILWFTRDRYDQFQDEIWTAERPAGLAPFRNLKPVLINGQPLLGTCPFYRTETNEFYFSRPVNGDKDVWEICRIKNFLKQE